MKKHFPPMMDCLGGGHIFCIFATWVVIFLLVPVWLPLISEGLQENQTIMAWFETVFIALIGIVMLLVMKEHLSDGFLGVQINGKQILKTAGIAAGLMAAWVAISAELLMLLKLNPGIVFAVFPVAPTNVLQIPGMIVSANPIFGLLIMTLLVPFGVCGMFYASTFAPICTRNTWLAYLIVSVVILLAALIDAFWYWGMDSAMITYVIRLPVHLFACWSYQKTDNVWTPIFALAAFNLLMSVMAVIVL